MLAILPLYNLITPISLAAAVNYQSSNENSGVSFVLVVVFLTLIIFGASYLYSQRSEQKRAGKIKAAALQLGHPYFSKGEEELLGRSDHFDLFSKGYKKRMLNLIYNDIDDGEMVFFDYHYVTGGARANREWRQSVISFRSPSLDLPDFAVRPKGKIPTNQGIDYGSHP